MKSPLLISMQPSAELATLHVPPLNPGEYVSEVPRNQPHRVHVRRKPIRVPHGMVAAAIRTYREHALL